MEITIGGVAFEAYINEAGGVTVRDAQHRSALSASDRTEALLLFAILETLQGIKTQQAE